MDNIVQTMIIATPVMMIIWLGTYKMTQKVMRYKRKHIVAESRQ